MIRRLHPAIAPLIRLEQAEWRARRRRLRAETERRRRDPVATFLAGGGRIERLPDQTAQPVTARPAEAPAAPPDGFMEVPS